VRRTLAVLYTARVTSFDLRLTDEDRAYIAWVEDVRRFLQSVVDRCWDGINADIRKVFVDEDDLPLLVWTSTFIPGLRVSHPPSLLSAARRVGLEGPQLGPLARVWKALVETPAFRDARAGRDLIRRDSHLRATLIGHRARLLTELTRGALGGVAEESRRLATLCSTAYVGADPKVEEAARSLRAYNGLVQACLASLLGYAEDRSPWGPVRLDPDQPATFTYARHRLEVHLTTSDPAAVAMGLLAPFMLSDGGPVDGLYLSTMTSFQVTGSQTLVDVTGFRLRDLELAPA
jgi:hypothetical protein